VIARYVAKCLGEQNRRCVLISAETDATARLLARARFIINNLRLPPGVKKPKIGTDNTRALSFEETGSWFWIGTAGQRTFGRGDTITDLHLSEAAFYEDADKVRDGTFPAAELGEITIESTGNGRGNWFHRQAVRARNEMGFKLHEFYWPGLETCAVPLSAEQVERLLSNLDPALEEPELFDTGISAQQLAWRRERILTDYDGDLSKFKENYPRTFDECFQSTGRSFFAVVRKQLTAKWVQETKALWLLEGHPRADRSYFAGVDVGGGVGKDNSVVSIWCIETREQVAEWVANDVGADELGLAIVDLGRRFNWAYTNVERNNHGLTTLSVLVSRYPLDRLHRGSSSGAAPTQAILSQLSTYGTYTSETTRALLIGTAKRLLANEYTVHSTELESELDSFVETKTGHYEADSGCFDDRVFAACHALIVAERAAIVCLSEPIVNEVRVEDNPFSWEHIFRDAGRHSTDYGISETHT
jgi:hypothetical protein